MLSKTRKRQILLKLVPSLGAWLLKLLYLSCKVRFNGSKFPEQNAIYATWHGELIMTPFCYKKLQPHPFQVCVMTSEHFDGQLIAGVIQKIAGGFSIKGSTRKGGARVLIEALKVLKQKHTNLAISPDGPKGPRHEVAQGAVVIAQKLKLPIVTVNCTADRYWEFSSWDKMFLPKPFSRVDFYVSESFYLNELSLEEGIKKLKEKMMEHAHG